MERTVTIKGELSGRELDMIVPSRTVHVVIHTVRGTAEMAHAEIVSVKDGDTVETTNDSIEIPYEHAFYVRGAIDRGYQSVKQEIEKLRRIEYTSPEHRDEAKGMIAYHEQWLREFEKVVKSLPKEIRPNI